MRPNNYHIIHAVKTERLAHLTGYVARCSSLKGAVMSLAGTVKYIAVKCPMAYKPSGDIGVDNRREKCDKQQKDGYWQ
jgi:hypothetical protein